MAGPEAEARRRPAEPWARGPPTRPYFFQSTLDGGKTFTGLPSTPVGRTSVSGLTPLVTAGFEVSVTVNKQPQGPWSQTINILVL